MALLDLWKSNPDQLKDKQVQQLIAIAGDGKLSDNTACSTEFRSFLASIPAKNLQQYAEQCLSAAFEGSGFALQDIVNEVGSRIGATVTPGRYRGTKNHTGLDGLWLFPKKNSIVVEVKTSTAYSIDLSTIAGYLKTLIKKGEISEENSSILLVVGREETENLEAQIRGSRYAWSIRMISVEALLRLMFIKEEIEDPAILHTIHTLLVPYEFTRLDGIVNLLFSTAKEIKQEESASPEVKQNESNAEADGIAGKDILPKPSLASFYEGCIKRVQEKLGVSLVKRTRSGYSTPDSKIGLTCSISKEYSPDKKPNYWFAFHPHQEKFLEQYATSYVSLGCGTSESVLLIPFEKLRTWLAHSWTTKDDNENDMFRHIVIYRNGKTFRLNLKEGHDPIDVTSYFVIES